LEGSIEGARGLLGQGKQYQKSGVAVGEQAQGQAILGMQGGGKPTEHTTKEKKRKLKKKLKDRLGGKISRVPVELCQRTAVPSTGCTGGDEAKHPRLARFLAALKVVIKIKKKPAGVGVGLVLGHEGWKLNRLNKI
jgi:hypothetical protein